MIYWLIPYLVAYNASDAGVWRYGPEHVFKAEVRVSLKTDDLTEMHRSVDMYLACRPMNSSLIQCRVESAIQDKRTIEPDGSLKPHSPYPFEIGNIVFQVEFNEDGVSKILMKNAEGRYRHDMLLSIFETVNWGIDMSGKKYGSYDLVETSMIGSCETTFDIGERTPSEDETKNEKTIDGYSFDFPGFEGITRNETIVIEKNRNVDRCTDQTLYLFGKTYNQESDDKDGLRIKTHVTSSRSRIYLGRNSFSGYTSTTGNAEVRLSKGKLLKSYMNYMNADQHIQLSLETIRPAKEDIPQTGDSAKEEIP